MATDRREMLRLIACGAAGCSLVARPGFSGSVSHRALHWEEAGDKRVRCLLCPRKCVVADRERGTCGVRENLGGIYYTLVHSNPCALNNDPIEKKPLFHFRPGTKAFSIATVGCNIECRFCQNWEISQFRPEQVPHRNLSPEDVVRQALRFGSKSIAFTYSEPVVFYEYMRDICIAAKGTGLGRVMISNGYIEGKPLLELLPHLDAVKIDFKAFTEKFYTKVCSAHLRPVLDTLERLAEKKIWFELVVLIIPTLNDSAEELRGMTRWIVQRLGPDVPIHFTRFHPTYKIKNIPPTPVSTLEKARRIAMDAGINFAYAGNVPGHPGEQTNCPNCGESLIVRDGFHVTSNKIKRGGCPKCAKPVPGVW